MVWWGYIFFLKIRSSETTDLPQTGIGGLESAYKGAYVLKFCNWLDVVRSAPGVPRFQFMNKWVDPLLFQRVKII